MKGFIIYPSYENINGDTEIRLFGKLENGQSFLTINKFEPYLFVKKKHFSHSNVLKSLKYEDTNYKTFQEEELIKIIFKNQEMLNDFYKEMHKKLEIYEADIKPHIRFLIDNEILSEIEIEGEYSPGERIDKIFKEPKIKKSVSNPELKILSLDTESDEKGNLYCIGLTGKNYKKNFFITKHDLDNTISCKSEEECLEMFKKEIIKQDPDIIIGWNVIDFDLVYLKEKFKKNKISFDIGRTDSEVRLRIEKNFFTSSRADVEGRQVLDGLNLIKDPFIKEAPSIKSMKFESYTLEDVSQGILKKGKLISGENRHDEIISLYNQNTKQSHQKIADYNLTDCHLVYEILEKTKIINLAINRSKLTGQPLDRITGSIASFDSLYIREAHKKNLASPTNEYKKKESRIKGGFVSSLSPGIYHNVVVLDFKSLYPSIIRTFNIDPYSFTQKKENNSIKSPNGAYFKNQEGILPNIIEKLHSEREKAKREKNELASYAIKTIMNSFFGVLASPNCRYFDLKMANAITHFGQFIIKLTAKEIEKKGFKVIYSDTDSVFVETFSKKEEAKKVGIEIQDFINSFYNSLVEKEYKRKSFLELEFDKHYLSLMIPQTRGKDEKAAKKRYAGLVYEDGKETLDIVGLEAIRGDWTEAAQDFQKELLLKIFHNESADKFIKDYIKKIMEGKLDNKLIYRKSIRKNLEEYTKTTPPHVKAARQLDKLESNTISYIITTAGPEPIQKIKHKIDYEHYIEKQIKPIATQVLSLLNKKFDDLKIDSKQSTLF